ncbi:MAG: DapH/DapD/GlmU-related protein [Syntrophobacteraceae bacterium]
MSLKRLLYLALWHLVAGRLPGSNAPAGPVFKWVRFLVCRNLFKECGANVDIERRVRFGSGRNISLGDNSGIGANALLAGTVRIGKNVMMGPDVMMITQGHASMRTDIPMNLQGRDREKPIEIGDDVWLGARAILLPGVIIGCGVIIGAGAVVVDDIPDFAIAVGNPARVVKFRTAQELRFD